MNPIPDTPPALRAEHVTKSFGAHTALRDVNFAVPAGRVVGLLGQNGAGKSTLLHVAAGLIVPTSGSLETLGQPAAQLDAGALRRLGLVMQDARFIEWMTVRQHLEFTASFYPNWDRALQQRLVGLLELPLHRKIAELSPGDRQKTAALLGVCHRPALLLLDEPVSSLDPIARRHMLDVLIERLREDGCTIVISSHLLTDVEKIVDWVMVLDRGELVESCAFDELQESFAEWVVTAPPDRLLPDLDEPYVLERKLSGRVGRAIVRTREPEAVVAFEREHGVEVRSRPLTLDEMFPRLVGQRRSAS